MCRGCSGTWCGRYAGAGERRAAVLSEVNVELEVLRFQVRMAKDLNALPVTGHGEAARRLEQVGRGRRLAEGVAAEGGAGMKRHGDLWPAVVSWPNLVRAADRARRGKRRRDVVLRFDFDLERELLQLRRELIGGSYQPGPFTTHWISRPKPRLISAAPYRDRVVHHAILNVLEPLLDRSFHPDSYACRRGKGRTPPPAGFRC